MSVSNYCEPAAGIAPGQACVIYDGTRVVGSATIDRTQRTRFAIVRAR